MRAVTSTCISEQEDVHPVQPARPVAGGKSQDHIVDLSLRAGPPWRGIYLNLSFAWLRSCSSSTLLFDREGVDIDDDNLLPLDQSRHRVESSFLASRSESESSISNSIRQSKRDE